MKKTQLTLAIAAAAMVSTSTPVLATNGDNLIGLGAQARAMGGTGTAAFFGSENALTNPGLLGKSVGTEFAIGGTVFMPDVNAETNVAGVAASADSDADLNIIPEVSLSTRLDDNLTFGLGIFGSAGMGTDYRENPGLFNGYSNLQIMKFAPSLAYNEGNFGIGFAPVIQYGALDVNYSAPDGSNVGNGMSSDLGFGFNLGGYFDVNENLTLALAYQSKIDMEYEGQMSTAAGALGVQGITDKLTQPAEIKVGVAYTQDNWMLTADAKQIKWSSAEGYKQFNWDDQNVFAVGAKYMGDGYWLGAGFNSGSDPIGVLSDTSYQNQAINLVNNHFFPAIVEKHVTAGGGYNINKNMAIDLALTYALEVDKTVNTGIVSDVLANGTSAGSFPVDATSHTTTHSQLGYTVSLRMNF
ncbi:MAG: outer membrane protein transport protein [Thiotrichales bacterium]|nr:outer membrane protein transport protein [Thiotrichales bacterium]